MNMKLINGMILFGLFVGTTAHGQRNQYDQHGYGSGNQHGSYRYDSYQHETSVLSVFSENGEPFFLILNGVRQNMAPQSKIRVESLPKYMTDVEVAFADSRAPHLHKAVSISDPIDGKAVNLTMRIERGHDGYPKLKFHRMTECDRNYHGPRDEYVMYYGKPQQINTVTETSYMDPVTGQWVTETTTTTTNSNQQNYTNDQRNNNYNNNYAPPAPPAPVAMDQRMFNDVKQSVSSASFEDTKLSTAKTILGTNYVNTDQVIELCKLFSFENTKLTFAQFAYNRTVDPQNYFKVAGVFDFDSNKKALNDFISRNPR
jgi:hypothetical protein